MKLCETCHRLHIWFYTSQASFLWITFQCSISKQPTDFLTFVLKPEWQHWHLRTVHVHYSTSFSLTYRKKITTLNWCDPDQRTHELGNRSTDHKDENVFMKKITNPENAQLLFPVLFLLWDQQPNLNANLTLWKENLITSHTLIKPWFWQPPALVRKLYKLHIFFSLCL